MKTESIYNLLDMLEVYENEKLDLEMDFKNSELRHRKDIIQENIKQKAVKIKELKDCIKWIKKQN